MPRSFASAPAGDDDAYARHKARASARQAGISAAGRDIALPEVEDPQRREACRLNLKLYLLTYHPDSFPLTFSKDHEEMIETLQVVSLIGGLYAFAMPRGSGKTTIARHAAQWAINYGHRRFLVLIGANNEFGSQLLEQIVLDYETSDRLLADFPEICVPLRTLEGIRNRCRGQTVGGEPTNMQFRQRLWRMPSVEGSPSSGAIIKSGSPKSAVRGANLLIDGKTVRPDLVLIDDPQTRATAESPKQVARLIATINGDVLGCAGPGQTIAVAMPCTVIAPGDAADMLLDRELHPRWNGHRCKLLYAFPARIDLWEQYWEIYCDALREGTAGTPDAANDFYVANRDEMDRGAVPAWEQRKRPDELSAIQHAMTLYLADPSAFKAEYQNEPTDPHSEILQMTPDLWRSRVTDRVRGIVPDWASKLTAFIDCHKRVLVWSASAWSHDFTGCGLDYGTHPDQAVRLWRVQTARPTLQDVAPPNSGDSAALRAGILKLLDRLASRVWLRDDGQEMTISRILVDTGWEPDVINAAIKESRHRSLVIPFKGTGKGANEPHVSDYKKRPGESRGPEWIRRPTLGVLADTWYWKTFLSQRLAAVPGDPGSFTWFGREADGTKADHTQLIAQLSAEFATEERGERTVHRYAIKPGAEAHYLDTTTGSAIAASVEGISLVESSATTRKAVSLSELRSRAKR